MGTQHANISSASAQGSSSRGRYRCWYVYYKLGAHETQALRPHIAALLTAMQQKYAVLARLHQGQAFDPHNSASVTQTWMETYEESAETSLHLHGQLFTDALMQAVAHTPALALLAARRHTECFMEVPLCA